MSRLRRKPNDDYFSDEDFDFYDSPVSSKKRKNHHSASKYSQSVRIDNSLGVLTQKFVSLIQSSEKKCIDLNDAVKVSFT